MPIDTFDPRTAPRALYERERAFMLDSCRRGTFRAPAPTPQAAPAKPAPAAPPAVTADLDALRQADAVALAQRADREAQERRGGADVQTDIRAMGASEYQAALKLALPTYVRRF